MKPYYFTCGQKHSHRIDNGITWDKDSVLQVNAASEDEAREKVFELFGQKWGFCYDSDSISMQYYPNGVCAIISTVNLQQ